MTAKLNWDKINIDNSRVKSNKSSKNADGTEKRKKLYITLGKKAIGKTYIVRPVGSPVGVYKALIELPPQDGRRQFRNINVPMDEDGGDTHVRNHPLHIHHNVQFQAKYAINVIDREDNQLKILEGGISIFEAFRSYHEMTEKNPGGKNGADFSIEVTGQKGKDYYKTRKHQSTTLSDEEVSFLTKEGLYDLEEIYQETPEKVWQGWVDQMEGNDSSEASAPAPAPEPKKEEPVAASASSSDDLDALSDEIDADELPFG